MLVPLGHDASGRGGVTIDHREEGLRKVAQKMPPICHLYRPWGSLPRTIRISPGPIPGDNLSSGMLMNPAGQSFSLSIGKEIDNFVLLQINQDGPISASPPPCPIIDAEDAWGVQPSLARCKGENSATQLSALIGQEMR